MMLFLCYPRLEEIDAVDRSLRAATAEAPLGKNGVKRRAGDCPNL